MNPRDFEAIVPILPIMANLGPSPALRIARDELTDAIRRVNWNDPSGRSLPFAGNDLPTSIRVG